MTDWLTRLEELEREATPGPWTTEHRDTYVAGPTIDNDWDWITGPIGENSEQDPKVDAMYRGTRISYNNKIICHLRNRSKEIAALVRAVKELHYDHTDSCDYDRKTQGRDFCFCGRDNLIEALNNLLSPEGSRDSGLGKGE